MHAITTLAQFLGSATRYALTDAEHPVGCQPWLTVSQPELTPIRGLVPSPNHGFPGNWRWNQFPGPTASNSGKWHWQRDLPSEPNGGNNAREAGGSPTRAEAQGATDQQFRMPQEAELEGAIATTASSIETLQRRRELLEQELQDAGACRALLYEQGKPLERAVIDALATIGFVATRHAEGESEFDVVFEAPEGRCLGEVEGKDSKAINIDKLSQLDRNLQEDFAREDVREYAKGVLFGNAERLTNPEARGDAFTAKCLSGAKRAHIALVRTPDLLDIVRYLKTHPDPNYAAECRKTILGADGDVVRFPALPVSADAQTEAGQTPGRP